MGQMFGCGKDEEEYNARYEDTKVVTTNKQFFYHYTTLDAARDIIKSGMLIKSSRAKSANRDAVYGDGVYLTQLPPTEKKHVIALNNWDGGVSNIEQLIIAGKLQACIRLNLDPETVIKAENPQDRDIYIYPGDLEITSDMEAVGYVL